MTETTVSDAKSTRISWRRVLTLVASILAGALAICWLLEPWYFAWELSRREPQLYVTPKPLSITNRAEVDPERISAFEYSFQVPWNQIDKRKDSRSVTIIRFQGGGIVMVFNPNQLTNLSAQLRGNARDLDRVFGSRALSSGYNWMEAELMANPGDIHWWDRRGNVRTAVLLGLKQIDILDDRAIYRIANREMHGFQFGDPANPRHRVRLELFDVNDRRYEIMISSTAPAGLLNQPQVNAIIDSIRPIPHS